MMTNQNRCDRGHPLTNPTARPAPTAEGVRPCGWREKKNPSASLRCETFFFLSFFLCVVFAASDFFKRWESESLLCHACVWSGRRRNEADLFVPQIFHRAFGGGERSFLSFTSTTLVTSWVLGVYVCARVVCVLRCVIIFSFNYVFFKNLFYFMTINRKGNSSKVVTSHFQAVSAGRTWN